MEKDKQDSGPEKERAEKEEVEYAESDHSSSPSGSEETSGEKLGPMPTHQYSRVSSIFTNLTGTDLFWAQWMHMHLWQCSTNSIVPSPGRSNFQKWPCRAT